MLHKADFEGQFHPLHLAQIGLIAGDRLPPLIGLQHYLIDCPGQRIERRAIAPAAPIEQAGYREARFRGQVGAQLPQKSCIAGKPACRRIKIDLDTCNPVTLGPPAFNVAQYPREDIFIPSEAFDAIDDPDLRMLHPWHRRTQVDIASLRPALDLSSKDIDGLCIIEHRLRINPGP